MRFSIDRVSAILRKEWQEAVTTAMIAVTAVVLGVVMAVVPLVAINGAGRPDKRSDPELERGIQRAILRGAPYAGLSAIDAVQVHLGGALMVLFLIAPAALPSVIAAYSIVGEKRERSLEPLLATPISVGELLIGKALAAAIPGVVVGWSSFALFAVGLRFIAVSDEAYRMLLRPTWVLSVALVSPLLAILAAAAGLMVSTRVNDPRAAQSLTGLLVLPMIGLVPAQLAGALTVTTGTVLVGVFGFALLDLVLLYFAARLFERETILTRWK
jgi:ABC-2 type transport system permease protein